MKGKVCLVTGATNGIGKSTALGLARLGATVVVVGRNEAKTAETVQAIQDATGNPNVAALRADLSSQQEVRRLAQEFQSRYPQLHVLINNAGGIFNQRELSVDGIEMTFALNHLAYFLLTHLLLQNLQAGAPARIINVSSDAHRGIPLDFANLQGQRSYSAFGAYGLSKLANLLFTTELARRLEGSGVVVNALHPGVVNTGIGKNNNGWIFRLYNLLLPLMAITPEEGAKTSLYLASSAEAAGISGQYFSRSKPAAMDRRADDPVLAAKLWASSAQLVGLE